MNNDDLRLSSKETDDDIIQDEFNARQPEKNEDEVLKLNLFTLLKGNKNGVSWNLINKKNILQVALITLSFSLFLLFISVISDSVIFLIMGSLVVSVALPLCFIVFLYELNNMRNVSVGNICISIAIGIAFYAIVRLCKEPIERYFTSIPAMLFWGDVILAVVDDFLLFIISCVTARLFKKDCMFGTMLIVVSICSGYSIADTLYKLLSSMFITVNITENSVSTFTIAMMKDAKFYKETLKKFFPVLLKEGIYMTVLMSLWSVIFGTLVSIIVSPIDTEFHGKFLILLLCVSVILMHAAVILRYASVAFGFFINIFVVIVTTVIAINLLNYSLSITNYDSTIG